MFNTHISKASSLDNSDFVIATSLFPRIVSAIYNRLLSLNAVFRFMPRHDSNVVMLVNVVRAVVIPIWISFADLPPSVIKPRKYTYDDTCSICCPSISTLKVTLKVHFSFPDNNAVSSALYFASKCVTLHIENMSENHFRI